MILLLQGGSKLARSVIAAKFADKHKGWQHLPAEEVNSATSALGFDLFDAPEVLALMACTCAVEVSDQEDVNILLSCGDEVPILQSFREECGKKSIAVHLRSKKSVLEDDEFDHVLEASTSAEKAIKALTDIIKK